MESGTPYKKMRLAPGSAPSTPYHAASPGSSSSALGSGGSLTAKPPLPLTPEQQARISANRKAGAYVALVDEWDWNRGGLPGPRLRQVAGVDAKQKTTWCLILTLLSLVS